MWCSCDANDIWKKDIPRTWAGRRGLKWKQSLSCDDFKSCITDLPSSATERLKNLKKIVFTSRFAIYIKFMVVISVGGTVASKPLHADFSKCLYYSDIITRCNSTFRLKDLYGGVGTAAGGVTGSRLVLPREWRCFTLERFRPLKITSRQRLQISLYMAGRNQMSTRNFVKENIFCYQQRLHLRYKVTVLSCPGSLQVLPKEK